MYTYEPEVVTAIIEDGCVKIKSEYFDDFPIKLEDVADFLATLGCLEPGGDITTSNGYRLELDCEGVLFMSSAGGDYCELYCGESGLELLTLTIMDAQ